MIKLDFNQNNTLSQNSLDYLTTIIKYTIPDEWKQYSNSISIEPDGSKASITNPNGKILSISSSIINNSLDSLNFISDDFNSSWIASPLNELTLQSNLQNNLNDSNQIRSPWAVRQDLINDSFSLPYANTDFEYDGIYNVDENFLLSIDSMETILDPYWFHMEQTCKNYLKQNNILQTNIYSLSHISNIQLINNTLFVFSNSGEQIEFFDISLPQQFIITEELLNR